MTDKFFANCLLYDVPSCTNKDKAGREVTMHDIGEGTKRFVVFVGTAWNIIVKNYQS